MSDMKKWQSAIVYTDDSLDEANNLAYERGWTDGLPIVPPTEARVSQMLRSADRNPDGVVATLPPKAGAATVEKIAINAVMAGCLPTYLPVLIAGVEAMAEPQLNLHGMQATTNPVGPMTIINGPVRKDLGMNSGRSVMGPGNRANATIGRAMRLIMLNIGGGIPEEVDKASQGYPGKYVFCIAENEEESVFEPLHVERGFKKEDSTVTIVGAQGTTNVVTACLIDIKDMLKVIANAMNYMGSNNVLLGAGEPLLLLTPGHTELLRKAGFSKQDTKKLLWDLLGFPLSDYPPSMRRERMEKATDDKGIIRPCRRAEDIMIVSAGGPEPYHATFVPTFGDTWAVTKRIDWKG
ncbi:MAG: hypothetical protein HYX92_20875 [Chloroflexi bacterium]|nr:hypothetical protein [Chloroflexota bacterium]